MDGYGRKSDKKPIKQFRFTYRFYEKSLELSVKVYNLRKSACWASIMLFCIIFEFFNMLFSNIAYYLCPYPFIFNDALVLN